MPTNRRFTLRSVLIYVTLLAVSLGMMRASFYIDTLLLAVLGVAGSHLFLALVGFFIGGRFGGPDGPMLGVLIAILIGCCLFLLLIPPIEFR